jgi:hypothetical protein
VLYELLAGQRPYVLKRDSRAALEEAIVQAEVPPPSARAAVSLQRALRGDLDTIVLMALQKDPSRRYATVAALAEDIERHLAHRPVLAQPDSAAYRLAKFVRRNRLAVGTVAAVSGALLAGAGVAAWQAVQARAEQRRAQEVLAFVTSIFRDADPSVGPQERPSASELLARARTRVDAQFVPASATRLELLNVLAESFLGLQDIDRAAEAATAALGEATRAAAATGRRCARKSSASSRPCRRTRCATRRAGCAR